MFVRLLYEVSGELISLPSVLLVLLAERVLMVAVYYRTNLTML